MTDQPAAIPGASPSCPRSRLGTLLSACAPLIVGGAAVGGALVATDRRTSGAQLEDEGIELRAASRIRQNLGERVHVNATSYNRQVLLTGEVPSAQDKAAGRADRLAGRQRALRRQRAGACWERRR